MRALKAIKALHTVVWAFFAACFSMAKHNKLVFGTLYAAGLVFALFQWARTTG
jgi:hypothetical protein